MTTKLVTTVVLEFVVFAITIRFMYMCVVFVTFTISCLIHFDIIMINSPLAITAKFVDHYFTLDNFIFE